MRRASIYRGAVVSPVALTVNEQVFLAHIHERVADSGIAVRVVLHGLTNKVGHLVVASVVLLEHGVQNAALNGFETVFHRRHGAFENDIAGIVQEIILIHATEGYYGVFTVKGDLRGQRVVSIFT